jgi:hypothetical protein
VTASSTSTAAKNSGRAVMTLRESEMRLIEALVRVLPSLLAKMNV